MTYGDKKLKWYDINTTGVETLITTATVAEDGNAIRISAMVVIIKFLTGSYS